MPVKWCGPFSGCFMRSPPSSVAPGNLHNRNSPVNTSTPRGRSPLPRTIAGQVAERLKAEILAGERAPGSRLRAGGDRPAARRQHDAGARGARDAAARGPRPARGPARRGRLPAQRARPARALRDPRGARVAGRGEGRRALRARVGGAARGACSTRCATARPPRATSRSTSASTRRSTSTPARPQLVAMIAALRDASSAYLHIYRAQDDFPVARLDAEHRDDPGGVRRRAIPQPRRQRHPARTSRTPSSTSPRGCDRSAPPTSAASRGPTDLIRTMFAKQEGVPVDPVALEQRTRTAVAEVVGKQREAGVDVISDGEMGKPSYVTYITRPPRRLRRHEPAAHVRRPRRLPGAARQGVRRPRPQAPPHAGLRRADQRPRPARPRAPTSSTCSPRSNPATTGFMNAASPGVIALYFRNDHYASREEYLYAIADAMRVEYEAITDAGLLLQIDCPDLAMGRHIQFADAALEEFRREARLNIEALNHATREHRARPDADAPVLGQLRGPAPPRRAARRHHRPRLRRQPQRDRVRGRQPAPRARVGDLRGRQAARRQGRDPGRDRVQEQLHRAPGADRAADRALRAAGRARRT